MASLTNGTDFSLIGSRLFPKKSATKLHPIYAVVLKTTGYVLGKYSFL
jgi:hypothetical protein